MNIIKYILGVSAVFVVVLVVALLPAGLRFARDIVEAERVGILVGEVEAQLGFDNYTPPDGQRGGGSGYPMGDTSLFTSIEPHGVFDQAGFRKGDVIPMLHFDFFGLILLNQGKLISIPIIRDGENLVIQVDIPELELSYDPCEFRVFECNE